MVEKPNIGPNNPMKGPTPTPDADSPAAPKKAWNPKPLTWMGMTFDVEQTRQLWNTITQSIGQAIQKDKDRAVQASRKLRKSTDPDDDDDS